VWYDSRCKERRKEIDWLVKSWSSLLSLTARVCTGAGFREAAILPLILSL
jgi:hypothetical protein